MLEVKQEKKEIEVTIKYLKCDLCEKRITPEEPMLTIRVSKPYSNLDVVMQTKRDYGELDVCSTECLVSNIGGAQLILDTRLIPEAREQSAREAKEGLQQYKKEDYVLTKAVGTSDSASTITFDAATSDTSKYTTTVHTKMK